MTSPISPEGTVGVAAKLHKVESDARQMGIQLCEARNTIINLRGLVHHANKDAFANGVVSEQGQDEGETIASNILSESQHVLERLQLACPESLERDTATLPALKQRVEELEKMLADTEDALEWHAANEARFWGIEDVHGYAKAAKNLLIKVKQALTPKDKATE